MEVTSRAPRRFVGALQGRAAVTVMRTSLRTPGGPSNMAAWEIPSQWGIEWKQTTIIDVPLACLITRGYFGLKMFESRWQSPKTVLQVLVFQQIAGILATVG